MTENNYFILVSLRSWLYNSGASKADLKFVIRRPRSSEARIGIT